MSNFSEKGISRWRLGGLAGSAKGLADFCPSGSLLSRSDLHEDRSSGIGVNQVPTPEETEAPTCNNLDLGGNNGGMAHHSEERTSTSGAGFPATRWSLVDLASGSAGGEVLEELCRAYWYPLYAFARRSGQNANDAEDLTQGFFQKLLEKHWLADAEKEKGRLRTFLLTAFRRYMANEWRRENAQVRGGGWSRVEWERADGELRYARSSDGARPEDLFERQWALAVMERTLAGLQRDFEQRGKCRDFEELKAVLMLERGAIDYRALAERLQATEGATRVAVHRLRKQFRIRFRDEVVLTLEEGEDLEEELQHLSQVLAG